MYVYIGSNLFSYLILLQFFFDPCDGAVLMGLEITNGLPHDLFQILPDGEIAVQ